MVIYNTKEYVYSEGVVRLVQLSPDIPEESKNRQTRFSDNADARINEQRQETQGER